jgi:hypothetical protein
MDLLASCRSVLNFDVNCLDANIYIRVYICYYVSEVDSLTVFNWKEAVSTSWVDRH